MDKIILLQLLPNLWDGANKDNPGMKDLTILAGNLAKIAIALVGTIALLFLIIGGFQYITSAGNPEQTEKAKKTLLYAVIGLVLAISSYAIIVFITSKI